MKKLFTLLFAVMACVGTNAEKVMIGSLFYDLSSYSKTASVAQGNYKNMKSAYIPSSVTYNSVEYKVTSIDDYAFNECRDLTYVSIPNTVTSIGDRAFMLCNGLTSIQLPSGLMTIGESAFWGCTGLTAFNVAEENLYFSSVDGVLFNKNQTKLLQYLIGKSETSYSIPNTVTEIGEWAFYNCGNLTTVTIPNSVVTIGPKAFDNCDGLTSIKIPNSVTSIGEEAFYNCNKLSSLTIGEGVKSIGSNAFYNCLSLTSLEIPNSVTTIGAFAFGACSGLKSLTIGSGVTNIGGKALYDCQGLTSITCKAVDPPSTAFLDGKAFFEGVNTSIPLYVPAGSIEAYRNESPWSWFTNILPIEETPTAEPCITASGKCGAYGENMTWELSCDGVLTISGVDKMKGYSYPDYEPWYPQRFSIKSVVLSDGITSLGRNSFNGCTGLTSVTIPNSVTTIDACAFLGCHGLTAVSIPNTVTTIESSAFSHCSGLTSMVVEAGNPVYDSRNNCNAIIETASNKLISGCQNTIISNSVTSIGEYAFSGCTGLTSVTIPNSVTTIETSAFFDCEGLTSVTIPNSVTSLGDDVFNLCFYLTSVKISDNVTSLGNSVFFGCHSLTSVTIPKSVTNIGDNAFGRCLGLTSVTCEAIVPPTLSANAFEEVDKSIPLYVPAESVEAYRNADQWNAFINILPIEETPQPCSSISGTCGENLTWELSCDGVLTITGSGSMAYFPNAEDVPWDKYRSQIASVILPDGLTFIGNSAFFLCKKLTSVVIPNTVTIIGTYAFSACSHLSSITLSNSLTSIGACALAGCSSLETIELPSSLTSLGKMAFAESFKSTSTITCKAILPPECKDEVFQNVDPNIPLYVPAESVEAYRNTDQWNAFINIKPIEGEDPFIPVGTDISVAKAIEIGQELEIGAKTTIEYTITGYVSAIADGYDEKNGVQSFWIADENILANSNDAGALYIYRGNVSKELAFGNKVSVKAYIANYNGLLETYNGGVVTILNDEESVPELISGICGEEGDGTNLTWQLNTKTGTLEIKGAGKMASLIEKMAGAPENLFWHYFRPYIHKIILPADLTKIGNHAFYQCENLESVVIPDKVDTIGKYAFTGCVKLTQINMPESVRALGANAFYGTSITNPVYNSKIFGYMPKSYAGKYVVPEGIVSIATRSFVNCDKLTEIIMPESLKRLGTDVYDGCSALQSLTCYAVNPPECVHTFTGIDMSIPLYVPAESVDAYNDAEEWNDFTNILPIEVKPEPNKYIITFLNDDGSQLDQREWEEGETPTCKEPTKQDDDYIYCFKGWNPQIVPVTETATYQAEYEVCGGWLAGGINWRIYKDTLIVSGNGVIPDYEQGAAPWLPYDSRINAIRVAKGITRIGEWAFADMTPIRVQIAQGVTVMGANAFKGSSTIKKVVFDGYDYEWAEINFVNEFSNPLYYGASFNHLELHVNVTTTTISTSAFVGFSTVVYHGTIEQWSSMTFTSDYYPSYDLKINDVLVTELCFGEGLTKISAHAWHGCSSIERVCIPISLKQIGQDAFKNMPNLKRVSYAGDLKQWSAITFANGEANPACHADLYFGETKLGTRLDIPDSVTVINAFAFPNTKTLNVYFHHMDPAGYELNSFGEPDQVGDKHFYVPCGTKDAYQKRLNYAVELFEEYFHYSYKVVSADEQKGKVSILHEPTCDEPQLEIQATPNQGFRFVEWSDGSTEAQRSLTLNSDTVLEASFDLNSYMVYFINWNGVLLAEQEVKYGSAAVAPEVPARENYQFIGWNVDIDAIVDRTFAVAQFEKEETQGEYTIHYHNTADDTEIAAEKIDLHFPEPPEIEGFVFVGWQAVCDEFIVEGMEIQAVYEPVLPLSAEQVVVNPSNPAQKLFRNGTVYVLQDEKVYTVTGQTVK